MRLIDADELKKQLKSGFDTSDYYTEHDQFIVDVCQLLDNAPTVEERPQGKWVEVERQGKTGDGRVFTFTIIVCSKCGEQYDLEGEKFCPHCGADMRGEKE